jgi:hypothetical protein
LHGLDAPVPTIWASVSEGELMDAMYLVLAVGSWIVMVGFAAGCAKLEGKKT